MPSHAYSMLSSWDRRRLARGTGVCCAVHACGKDWLLFGRVPALPWNQEVVGDRPADYVPPEPKDGVQVA